MRYQQALMTQVMQTTVCNGLHSAEQRCCRWLLMAHDRIQRDEFPLTHETLAMMLGVRRPTITLIAASLQRTGLIHCRRDAGGAVKGGRTDADTPPMGRVFVRDGERLTCELRPAHAGAGFEVVWTQDGEHHVEHYALEIQARARSARVEEDLIHDGWSVVS